MAAPRKPIRRSGTTTPQRPTNQTPDPEEDEEETVVTEDQDDSTDPETDLGEDGNDGDDSGDSPDDNQPSESIQSTNDDLPPMRGAPRDGRTFRVGEKVIFKGEKRGGLIYVVEPVYRGVLSPGSDRYRFHLLLGKGSSVSSSKAKEVESGVFESKADLTH